MIQTTPDRGGRDFSRRGLLLGIGGAGLLGLTALSASPARAGVPALDHSGIVTNMATRNLEQVSQALIVQAYAHSALAQPAVDFKNAPTLAVYQKEINTGLEAAKDHARFYLDKAQPGIITNLTNIENYYNLHSAVPVTLPPGATEAMWIEMLQALRNEARTYEDVAQGTLLNLQDLERKLTADAGAFQRNITDLNAAVNGDHGMIQSLDHQLSSIQSKIDGAIAGIVISSVTVVGGIIMIGVGAVGMAAGGGGGGLVLGGIGLVAAGAAGDIGAAFALKALNEEKASLLGQKSKLSEEVTLGTAISSAYGTLSGQLQNSVMAAGQMQNAWQELHANLDTMIDDLDKGMISAGAVRELYLRGANAEVKNLLADIATIKAQMAGTKLLVAAPGQSVGDAILKAIS